MESLDSSRSCREGWVETELPFESRRHTEHISLLTERASRE